MHMRTDPLFSPIGMGSEKMSGHLISIRVVAPLQIQRASAGCIGHASQARVYESEELICPCILRIKGDHYLEFRAGFGQTPKRVKLLLYVDMVSLSTQRNH